MSPDTTDLSRKLWSAAFVSNAAWIGFVTVLVLAGRTLPSPPGGTAAARALMFGVAGAVTAAVAARVVVKRSGPATVRSLALLALLVAAALAVVIVSL